MMAFCKAQTNQSSEGCLCASKLFEKSYALIILPHHVVWLDFSFPHKCTCAITPSESMYSNESTAYVQTMQMCESFDVQQPASVSYSSLKDDFVLNLNTMK